MDNNPDLNSLPSLPAPNDAVIDATANQIISDGPVEPSLNNVPTTNSSPETNNPTEIKIVDNDLIDKEWIDKVKKILHQTTGNPYQQSVEINKLKIDFLKQKYNKIIKA